MKIKAILYNNAGKSEQIVQAKFSKSEFGKLAGITVVRELPYGILAEFDDKLVPAIEKKRWRVQPLPELNLVRAGEYSITTDNRTTPAVPKELNLTTAQRASWKHHIVQFVAPPDQSWMKSITQLGAAVIEKISRYAWFVVATPEQMKLVAKLDFVAWSGPFLPAYRVNRSLKNKKGVLKYISVGLRDASAIRLLKTELLKKSAKLMSEERNVNGYTLLRFTLDAKHITWLASQPEVRFVEYEPEPNPEDERTCQISAEGLDGVAAPNTAPVTGYLARLNSMGITGGTGVTIAICDSGVDTNDIAPGNPTLHGDLKGRFTFFADMSAGAVPNDPEGHGTHVAGIAAGNASLGDTDPEGFLLGMGLAPAAFIGSINPIGNGTGTSTTQWLQAAATNGAQVMNNSWGVDDDYAGYTARCQLIDQRVRDSDANTAGVQSMNIIFSAGNDGDSAQGTITSPHETKNAIVVGNLLNFRPDEGFPTEDIRGISASSSRGPAIDGRILPHLMATGTDVVSALSPTSADYDTYTDTDDVEHPSYTSQSGTSMSAPNVTGVCALFIEWWRNRTGGQTPSPALVKAALINGAIDLIGGENWKDINRHKNDPAAWSLHAGFIYKRVMPFVPNRLAYAGRIQTKVASLALLNDKRKWFYDAGTSTLHVWLFDESNPGDGASTLAAEHPNAIAGVPNNDQGWGRVSIENIVLQGTDRGPKIFFDRNLADVVFTANGQIYEREIVPVDATKPLRITLAWSDAPGAADANPALVNDLDLEVDELLADGTFVKTFKGNVFDPATGFSITGGNADTLNNVECVYIKNPGKRYRMRVIASSVTGNALPPFDATPFQDFAYVVDNAIRTVDNPVCVVPVVDRSGSMVTYGYVDTTRTTTKNFIDLMSVNDSLGVVSFGSTGITEYSNGANLSTISGDAEKTAAKNAVDAIAFGGCTYMSEGVTRGRDLLNTGAASQEKAMVLLSDGFDNGGCNAANPKALTVVSDAAWPATIPVYTCAMGATADAAGLEEIATVTEGRFYSIPVIDDLAEAYNFIRAQVAEDDESLITNTSAFASLGSVKSFVETGAKRVTFSVNWLKENLAFTPHIPKSKTQISVRLIDPKGKKLPAESSLVHRQVGKGYVILRIEDPAPGTWTVEVETKLTEHTRFTVGAFVKSPIRLHIPKMPQRIKLGTAFQLPFQVLQNGKAMTSQRASVSLRASAGNPNDLLKKYRAEISKIKVTVDKDGNADLARLLIYDKKLRTEGKPGIFSAGTQSIPTVEYSSLKQVVNGKTLPELLRISKQPLPQFIAGPIINTSFVPANRGVYKAMIEISGFSKELNTKFVRVDTLDVWVV